MVGAYKRRIVVAPRVLVVGMFPWYLVGACKGKLVAPRVLRVIASFFGSWGSAHDGRLIVAYRCISWLP